MSGDKNKLVAGLLGIFLGGLGVHKFYLGCNKAGIIMLVVSLLGFVLLGIPTLIMTLIGFIEGILYIVKSENDYKATYIDNQKCWF